jgi:hypothetical protein
MSEFEKAKQNGKKDISQDVITDIDTEIEKELPPVQPGLGKRVRQALKNMQQGGPAPRQELAKDRTRSFALLIGGTVGAVLLFIGVFSTPTPPPETSERSDSPKPRKRSGTRSANGGTKLGHAARFGRVELDRNFLDLTPNGRGDWYAKLDYVSHFRKSISREEKSPDAQAYSQMQCSLGLDIS